MDNILKLTLHVKIEDIEVRPRSLSYVYNKNTNLQSSYTSIYIPRYIRLPRNIRLDPTNSEQYTLLRKFIGYRGMKTVKDLHKAQAIFLDKNNLKQFMETLNQKSNKPNKDILTANANYIVGLFFKKESPFYSGNNKYKILSADIINGTCKHININNKLLREDADHAHYKDIHNRIVARYKRAGDDTSDPFIIREIRAETKRIYANLLPKDKKDYRQQYIEKNSNYQCKVTIKLKTKDVKSVTLKRKLKNKLQDIKDNIYVYHRGTCKDKRKEIEEDWDDLCLIKSLNNVYPSDLWNEMCRCSNCRS